jgi:hypothetical protein
MQYRIRKIRVRSAAQAGFVAGLFIGVLPALFNVLVVRYFAHNLNELLRNFDKGISVGPFQIVNFADQLGLRPTLDSVVSFDTFGTYLLYFLLGIILMGAVLSGLSSLGAWLYNRLPPRFGKLELTLEPIGATPAAPAAPLVTQSVPPPVQPALANVAPAIRPIARPISGPMAPLPTASGPRFCLVANPAQVWFVSKSPFTIGSLPGSDLYTATLLSQHARLDYDPAANGYVLTDLSNGQAWVNDHVVQGRHKLNNGFRVRLGQVDLIFYV